MIETPPRILIAEGLGDTPRQFVVWPHEAILIEVEGYEAGRYVVVAGWRIPTMETITADDIPEGLAEFLAEYDRHTARFLAEHGAEPWRQP